MIMHSTAYWKSVFCSACADSMSTGNLSTEETDRVDAQGESYNYKTSRFRAHTQDFGHSSLICRFRKSVLSRRLVQAL